MFFEFELKPGTCPPEEIADLLDAMSRAWAAMRGVGLVFTLGDGCTVIASEVAKPWWWKLWRNPAAISFNDAKSVIFSTLGESNGSRSN